MSEKDKMLAGELYSAGDATLTADRERCQTLLQRLNAAPIAQERERGQILKELFKRVPDESPLGAEQEGRVSPHIEPTFRCDYGYNITVGKNFYANFDCCILDCASVTIGDDVFFGPRVQIYTAGHPVVPRIRGNFRSGLEFAKPITIGHRYSRQMMDLYAEHQIKRDPRVRVMIVRMHVRRLQKGAQHPRLCYAKEMLLGPVLSDQWMLVSSMNHRRAEAPCQTNHAARARRCWLGGGACVLPGVTIGDDVTVGACSVVTKDVPRGVIVAGNPARIIRKVSDYDEELL